MDIHEVEPEEQKTMDEAVKRAVKSTLPPEIRDEAVVTGFVLVAETVLPGGRHAIAMLSDHPGTPWKTAGLLRWGQRQNEHQAPEDV